VIHAAYNPSGMSGSRSAADTGGRDTNEARAALSCDPTDEALVTEARSGHVTAYGILVERHQRAIYRVIYQMTANREDAQDLVQDVFVKAHASLDRFKGQSRFSTWIYRIAVNQTLNHLKQRKRRTAMSLDQLDGSVERHVAYVELVARESPIRDASLNELQQRLNAALQKLSHKHRVVVVLHDIEGLPHEEISRILGVSSGTVRSRLHYAHQLLQNELKEFMP